MLLREFERLKVVDVPHSNNNDFNIGDYFITPSLEEQRNTKKIGDEIVVYMVIEVKENGNIVFMPTYLTLE